MAELDEKDKLTRKTYCVLVIDELIKIANANDWGLATQNGFLYVYEGKMWQLTEEPAIKNFLGEVALKMGVPKIEAQYHLFKDELFKQFISTANLPTPIKEDVTMVNLLNGVLIINDKESDSVAMFVEDEGYKKSHNYTPLNEMYLDYRSFCSDNGNKPCSKKIFSNRLKPHGFDAERKNFGMVVFAEK